MGTIRLYNTTEKNGEQFLLTTHPELSIFSGFIKDLYITKVNMEQYFTKQNLDMNKYTKLVYGPVFGSHDVRQGFIYENKDTEEMIIIDENDLVKTSTQEKVIHGDYIIQVTCDTSKINDKVIVDYEGMDEVSKLVDNPDKYDERIRNEFVPGVSFLIIL